MTLRTGSRRTPLLETLEARQLFTTFSFANFASTAGLALNGYNSSASTNGSNELLLTDGGTNEARSAIYTTPVAIGTFTTNFVYHPTSGGNANAGDGFTFVIDNGATTDLGGVGNDLGYGNGTFGANSVAVTLDFYDPMGVGVHFIVAQGGQRPNAMQNTLPVDFHNNHPVNGTITYDGTNLTLFLVDATDSSKTFSQATPIDLPGVLNSNSALVGFTGGSGNAMATQAIDSWDFTSGAVTPPPPPTTNGPVFTQVASSGAVNSAGTKSRLSAAVSDSSGSDVKYTWSTVIIPHGAPAPKFSVNNSASAANTTVQYLKDGTYHFRVTATDSNNASATSDVDVVVSQVATGLRLSPHGAKIARGTSRRFSGYTYDQFGRLFRSNPTTTFSVTSGAGSINSSGLYTASNTKGHVNVKVTVDELTGTVGATVV